MRVNGAVAYANAVPVICNANLDTRLATQVLGAIGGTGRFGRSVIDSQPPSLN